MNNEFALKNKRANIKFHNQRYINYIIYDFFFNTFFD